MKHIYLNLKRFDVPREYGGVNSLAPLNKWAETIIESTQKKLNKYKNSDVEFVQFYPELHLLEAVKALDSDSLIKIGSQGVYRDDVEIGKNFGALTTNLPAAILSELGCKYTLIGHCEERNDIRGIIEASGKTDEDAISIILNKEILAAQERDIKVLYCIGENNNQQTEWQNVLYNQIYFGLKGANKSDVVLAYEPIWSIGPGKQPADKEYITKVAKFIKKEFGDIDIVYGGGLKQDNASMLASIDEISGGLIALTRFQGDIGFYPDEYLEIIDLYLN
ncbi:triose-phosphate isomerase family protein [uncultured Anaerococcus sp.]|uniref:triose-phosphate isomerase family protein n=1 Tax=uncultured Anaerococcus sp. TaxID=293428 RepID=UPI00288B028C|nr:triose-phosphate isomerase family protein [uncultured Anaerococcus sp.]